MVSLICTFKTSFQLSPKDGDGGVDRETSCKFIEEIQAQGECGLG